MRRNRTSRENVNPLSGAQSSNQFKVRADLAINIAQILPMTIRQPMNNHTSPTTWIVDINKIVDIPFIDEESDEKVDLAQA